MGYVLKTDAESELLSAVDHVRHGQTFFTGTLSRRMIQNYLGLPTEQAEGKDKDDPFADSPLTPRELEVIQLLAEGKATKEVAYDLNVSTRTIESHRTHICTR
jgi:DNA-binding NarL/FixJ family response regulator